MNKFLTESAARTPFSILTLSTSGAFPHGLPVCPQSGSCPTLALSLFGRIVRQPSESTIHSQPPQVCQPSACAEAWRSPSYGAAISSAIAGTAAPKPVASASATAHPNVREAALADLLIIPPITRNSLDSLSPTSRESGRTNNPIPQMARSKASKHERGLS